MKCAQIKLLSLLWNWWHSIWNCTMGESTNFSEVLKNACDVATNVNIVALETTIRYPVFWIINVFESLSAIFE